MVLMVFGSLTGSSQNKIVKGNHPKKVVVVKKGHGFFHRRAVYHPIWGPRIAFSTRWVYFPRYNFYWDNYRNVYVIKTGTAWFTTNETPKEVEKVDLSKEKSIEMGGENDSKDSIQIDNNKHLKVYKVD